LTQQEISKTYYYLGEYEKSIEAGLTAISIDSDLYWANNWAGMSYEGLNDFTRAIECFDRTISSARRKNNDFECANGLKYKASVLSKLNRFEEALECNAEALKLNDYITYWLDRAWIYREASRIQDAINCYEEIVGKWPTDFYPHMRKGETLKNENRLREALDSYIKASNLIKSGAKSKVAFPNQLSNYLTNFNEIIEELTKQLNNDTG
jgi:tetratricopeptide (TPR) repeat protein